MCKTCQQSRDRIAAIWRQYAKRNPVRKLYDQARYERKSNAARPRAVALKDKTS